jgi:hypothetical protein
LFTAWRSPRPDRAKVSSVVPYFFWRGAGAAEVADRERHFKTDQRVGFGELVERSDGPGFASAPGAICSKPSASAQSTKPLSTACRAR